MSNLTTSPTTNQFNHTYTCRLCNSLANYQFNKIVLQKYNVAYYQCTNCFALQTETPYWLNEAYTEEAEKYDTGKATRTLLNFFFLNSIFKILHVSKSKPCIDFGGGTGLFSRLMRDVGYNYFTHDKYSSSEFSLNFNDKELAKKYHLITLSEVAEHFSDCAEEWTKLFESSPDYIIGSTEIFSTIDTNWGYLAENCGQHLFFYNVKTFEYIAVKNNYHFNRLGSYFILAKNMISSIQQNEIVTAYNSLYSSTKNTFDEWIGGLYKYPMLDNQYINDLYVIKSKNKKIIIDGVFFDSTRGVATLWNNLFSIWNESEISQVLVIINREYTSPIHKNITYVNAPLHNYSNIEIDRVNLQDICDQNDAALFISTYYSTPLTTPAALLVLDMIPERLGFDLTHPMWIEKQQAIAYAKKYISTSHNTQKDLHDLYNSNVSSLDSIVASCGTDLEASSFEVIADFKIRYSISKPYFIISGGQSSYKNIVLFFKAFEKLGAQRADYAILITNAPPELSPYALQCIGLAELHLVTISREDMSAAYGGAIALVYPSLYEGFGLPLLEAMACKCPIITCANSAIPEVCGNAAIYVDPINELEMYNALTTVQDEKVRLEMIANGALQAVNFSWHKMADIVGRALANWAASSIKS
jgi:glycosyltransferase involved in cell wall biosynthesis